MNRQRRPYLGWTFLLVCAISVAVAGVPAPATEAPGEPIGADAAIAVAAQYLGIERDKPGKVDVELLIPRDDNTPFLHKYINGRTCWMVTFSDLQIEMMNGHGERPVNPHIHGLNALIDARTTKLLRVWSTEQLGGPWTKHSAARIEKRFGYMSERWEGFPDAMPRWSLLRLLRDVWVDLGMEQLDAVYVRTNGGDRDWWMITMRATKPIGASTLRAPDPMEGAEQTEPFPIFGHRAAVDANTGEIVYGTNIYP